MYINFIVTPRDISAYMKRHNVVGSSAGYVERICDSYDSVDLKNVPIFTLSVLEIMVICLDQEVFSECSQIHGFIQVWGDRGHCFQSHG